MPLALTSAGSYLIVTDTASATSVPAFGPGPYEAVAEFLRDNDAFQVDSRREKHLLTFNPGGYLRRVSASGPACPASDSTSEWTGEC